MRTHLLSVKNYLFGISPPCHQRTHCKWLNRTEGLFQRLWVSTWLSFCFVFSMRKYKYCFLTTQACLFLINKLIVSSCSKSLSKCLLDVLSDCCDETHMLQIR